MKDINTFTDYMNSFYGPSGVYPSNRVLTVEEVANAVITMLDDKNLSFEGDSLDRERVRDILFSNEEQEKMYSKK